MLSELLARPNAEGVLENALAYAATLLGGDVNAYAVTRRSQSPDSAAQTKAAQTNGAQNLTAQNMTAQNMAAQDRVTAVFGYPRALIGTALSGPWSSMRPRVLPNGSAELYAVNPTETHKALDAAGMREVPLSLVVPLSDRGRTLGALMFDRTGAGAIAPAQQEAVVRWAAAVAPVLGLLEARDDWQRAARQLAGSVVEAVESREFDSLGHAPAVAEAAVRAGRSLGLAGRELEELWFAATLHDLGKIHGADGHALIGANFLQNVPQLAEAQKAIRHHHERWDGQGDPDRLVGEDIPLYARILAVADAYVRGGDMERVRAQAGKSLDPRVVEALGKALAKAGA